MPQVKSLPQPLAKPVEEFEGIEPKAEHFKAPKPPVIEGVLARKLSSITDERGRLMELLRCDWPEFLKFGQVYMTTAYPGVTKAWHYHKRQVDHFACLSGMMKLVLYDGRKNSKTFGAVNEFFMGEHNPLLVRIPAKVYHGFKGIGEKECVLINVPDVPYDYKQPDEYRLPAHTGKIPYDWSRKDG